MKEKPYQEFSNKRYDSTEKLIWRNEDKYHAKKTKRELYLLEDGVDIEDITPYELQAPKYCTNITLDLEFRDYCTDFYDWISYANSKDMHAAFNEWLRIIITPDVLEAIRNGRVKNLSIRIGQDTLRGKHLNGQEGKNEPF